MMHFTRLDMPEQEYRAFPAVSQSVLKAFWDCPRKFKLSTPSDPTPNMIFGSFVDSLWLKGDISKFAVAPEGTDFRTKAGKEWKASVPSDVSVVSWEMNLRGLGAINRLSNVPEIHKVREACDVQVAVFAELCGVQCKGLVDLAPKERRRGLADLKTAPSADPSEWSKYVYNNRLHWQAAMYIDLWNRATGEDLQEFFHIVVEQEAPHEPAMHALSRDFIHLGREQYRKALQLYAECKEKDEWPGYPMLTVIEPPKWALRD